MKPTKTLYKPCKSILWKLLLVVKICSADNAFKQGFRLSDFSKGVIELLPLILSDYADARPQTLFRECETVKSPFGDIFVLIFLKECLILLFGEMR